MRNLQSLVSHNHGFSVSKKYFYQHENKSANFAGEYDSTAKGRPRASTRSLFAVKTGNNLAHTPGRTFDDLQLVFLILFTLSYVVKVPCFTRQSKDMVEITSESSPDVITSLKQKDSSVTCLKTRYVLALMTALGGLNVHSLRNGINVSITAMTTKHSEGCLNLTQSDNLTSPDNTSASASNYTMFQENPGFNWTIAQQTLLLGSYYYGYFLTNLPGACVAKRFGIRLTLGLTGLASSVLTLLMPITVKQSFALAVGLRILVGFLQGVTFPSFITGWGLWAPPLERSRLISSSLSGVATGIFVVYPIVGLVISKYGWEASFYVTGSIGILYSLIFLSIIHDSPAVHPRISQQERDYIEVSIYGEKSPKDNVGIPWKCIATSLPVWACIASHIASNWAIITIGSLTPTYIAKVHGFNIKSVGFLSALPFLFGFVLMVVSGLLTDWILKKNWARVIVLRKVMACSPLVVSTCCLIILSYLTDAWPVIMLLCVSIGSLGLTPSGHVSSFVDIAPRYGGIIYSISNTFAGVIGFLAPQVAGAIIQDETLATNWRGVFWLSAAICVVGFLMFVFFASDKVQPWAQYNPTKTTTTSAKQTTGHL